MLVLVVDDDIALQMLSKAVLKSGGHEGAVAGNGREGYERALELQPGLVLLDVMMPEVDGFGALELLKGDDRTAHIPVVMVSARVAIEDRLRALERGAIDFLAKPFRPDELTSFISNIVLLGDQTIREHRLDVLSGLRHEAGILAEESPSRPEAPRPPLDVVADAVISLDDENSIASINRTAETVFGYLSNEIVEADASALLPDIQEGPGRPMLREGGPLSDDLAHPTSIQGRHRDGTTLDLKAAAVPMKTQSASTAVIVRDAQSSPLDDVAEGARQQAVLADISQRALEGEPLVDLMSHTVRSSAELLGAELGCLLRRVESEFEYVAALGWDLDDLASTRIPAVKGSLAGDCLITGSAVLVDDLAGQYPASANLHRSGVRSGICVPVRGHAATTGVLEVFSRTPNAFRPNDVHFLKSAANVLAAAIDRERTNSETRALFQALPDATMVVCDDGRITTVNPAAEELFGYSAAELLSMTVEQLVPTDLRSQHVDMRADYLRDRSTRQMGSSSQFRAVRKDGQEISVDVMLSPLTTAEEVKAVVTVRDVSERHRLDTMRDAFLHAVSHELRTPLTAVVGFSSLLRDGGMLDGADPGASEFVDRIYDSAMRLDQLLGDILDLDRLSRGIVEPIRRPTDLPRLVDEVLASMDLDEHPVTADIDADLDQALVDAAKVERIIENLVANAIKHTPAGTRVSVSGTRTPDGVLLTVSDEGPGVPDDLAPYVFEPFRRGNTHEHAPGTGIGLSLVARFAELHGGRAWLEQRPGEGTAFRVVLADARHPAGDLPCTPSAGETGSRMVTDEGRDQ